MTGKKREEQREDQGRSWAVLKVLSNPVQAEIVRGLLEAGGFQVRVQREALASLYGLTTGPLADSWLLVPGSQLEAARRYLDDWEEKGDPIS